MESKRNYAFGQRAFPILFSDIDGTLINSRHHIPGRTREKILEQVWDVNGNYVNDNTLTVTMKRLRDKLHQPECLKTVRSVGYRMEDTV